MFLVYINDLPDILEHSKCIMYADATVLYCGNDKVKDVCKMLQADLCKVQDWRTKNRLSLNVKKTKFMTFMSDHKRKNCMKFRFHMQGICLEEVNTYRYLGTEIDNRLDGEAQYNKLLQTLGFKLRSFGKSTILPIIDYNDPMLWNAGKLTKLQKTQKWGLRTVFNNVHTTR